MEDLGRMSQVSLTALQVRFLNPPQVNHVLVELAACEMSFGKCPEHQDSDGKERAKAEVMCGIGLSLSQKGCETFDQLFDHSSS